MLLGTLDRFLFAKLFRTGARHVVDNNFYDNAAVRFLLYTKKNYHLVY